MSMKWLLENHGVVWNIFLASIPVALAYASVSLDVCRARRPIAVVPLVLVVAAWVAFLPNTCYLLTEWRHYLSGLDSQDLYLKANRDPNYMIGLMRATVFFFCYGGIGMLAFVLALRPMHNLLKRYVSRTWIVAAPLFVALSLGVYLGLELRYNSWDLLRTPGLIWDDVTRLLDRPRLSTFILLFGGFLWMSYFALDVWIDGLTARWRAYTAGASGHERPEQVLAADES